VSGDPADAHAPSYVSARAFPALAGKVTLAGKPTAYVCRRGACSAPTSDPAALRRSLRRPR